MKPLCTQNNCRLYVIHLSCVFPKNASVARLVPSSSCSWTDLVYCCYFHCLYFMHRKSLSCRDTFVKGRTQRYGNTLCGETLFNSIPNITYAINAYCVLFWFLHKYRWKSLAGITAADLEAFRRVQNLVFAVAVHEKAALDKITSNTSKPSRHTTSNVYLCWGIKEMCHFLRQSVFCACLVE